MFMIVNDNVISRYQAYIVYGKNINEILRRIANYLNGCNNVVSDIELKKYFDSICGGSSPSYVEINDVKALDELIMRTEISKGIVLRAESPREDVYAIAFIPINQRNKEVASGR